MTRQRGAPLGVVAVDGRVAGTRGLVRCRVHLIRAEQERQQKVAPAPAVARHARQRVVHVQDVLQTARHSARYGPKDQLQWSRHTAKGSERAPAFEAQRQFDLSCHARTNGRRFIRKRTCAKTDSGKKRKTSASVVTDGALQGLGYDRDMWFRCDWVNCEYRSTPACRILWHVISSQQINVPALSVQYRACWFWSSSAIVHAHQITQFTHIKHKIVTSLCKMQIPHTFSKIVEMLQSIQMLSLFRTQNAGKLHNLSNKNLVTKIAQLCV